MPWDEKLAYAVNAFIGAGLALLIHLFGLGGLEAHLTRRAEWWNGRASVAVLCLLGALIGLISYHRRHEEIRVPLAGIYEGPHGAVLFIRRLSVIVGAVVALYVLWRLGRSI